MVHPYTVFDVANYFLSKGEEEQELLSNMKIQKLVYYAQGIHLALYDTPIFRDQLKAWAYGPVVPKLYGEYKHYGASGIPPSPSFDPQSIDKRASDFLDEIFKVFGQFSALRLMELSHTDKCWKDAFPNATITHNAMRSSLKKYIKHGKT